MRHKKLLCVLLPIVVILVIGAVLKPRPGPLDLNAYIGPFFDRGYDFEPRFDSFEKRSQYVVLSDGTRLAVDVFVPTGGAVQVHFPTILEYSPYSRSFAQPGMRWWERLFLW